MAQSRSDTPIAVALELVADRADPDEKVARRGRGRSVVESGARQPHQLASPADRDAAGPVTTEVLAPFGRGTCFNAPFSSSISSACRPTRRSRAAILASYSWIRSAAWTSSSRARASNLPTQMRISWPETPCRCDRPCSASPARNSGGHLPLERGGVRSVLGRGLLLRKPSNGVKQFAQSVHRQGRSPNRRAMGPLWQFVLEEPRPWVTRSRRRSGDQGGEAGLGVGSGAVFEASALVAGLDDVAMVGEAIE